MELDDKIEWRRELKGYPVTTLLLMLLGITTAEVPIAIFFFWMTQFRAISIFLSAVVWTFMLFITLVSRQIESKNKLPLPLRILALNILMVSFILFPVLGLSILFFAGTSMPLATPILVILISPGGAYAAYKIKKHCEAMSVASTLTAHNTD